MNQNMLDEMIAMSLSMANLECGGFIVGKSLMTLKKVRDFVSHESKGLKRFIAVKDGEMIKVIRIPDNSDLEMYYKNIKSATRTEGISRNKASSLSALLDNYLAKDWQTANKSCHLITEDMKRSRCIPLSYIQTYASNLSAFRNDSSGMVKDIIINEIKSHPRLTLLLPSEMKERYNTKVHIYKIDGDN